MSSRRAVTGNDVLEVNPNVGGKSPGIQQRFEESRVGRNVIGVLVMAIVLVGVGWNLPDSPIKRGLLPVLEPSTAVNLNQSWAVFAPNPPCDAMPSRCKS